MEIETKIRLEIARKISSENNPEIKAIEKALKQNG